MLLTSPLPRKTKTNFQRDFVATEGFQRLVDASEEEQRELRMLRAGGMLPPGIQVTPNSAAGQPSAASSAPTLGHWRQSALPSFLAGLANQLRKLPVFVKNSKGAPEARRRRHDVGVDVCRGSIRADDSRGRGAGGVTTGAELVLSPRRQREEDGRVLEARHAARDNVGGAECTRDVEIGERDGTTSRFVYHNSCRYSGHRTGGKGGDDEPVDWGCPEEAPVESGKG